MTEQTIYNQLLHMPEQLKLEVLHYIQFLTTNYKNNKTFELRQSATSGKRPVFGSAKGKYVLSPDFDEPLEDFNEYM